MRHFLSLKQLDPEELARLVDRSVDFATGSGRDQALAGKVVGIYFKRPSTRTRTSFTVGALKLGAQTIAYGPDDLQLVSGETLQDSGRVLSGYLDAMVVRTNEPLVEMEALAQQEEMAVINAMSAEEHPTQAIADLSTLKEAFGRLRGLHVLYVGEGNNTASALALACAKTAGMRLTLLTPEGYALSEHLLEPTREIACMCGSTIEQHHDPGRAPRGVDVVYTTRWQTMGVPKVEPDWQMKFKPFSVTQEFMAQVSRPEGTYFLHDLPAVRGDDVHDEVLDGPQSWAWRQARHKLFSAMAVLEWCVGPDPPPKK